MASLFQTEIYIHWEWAAALSGKTMMVGDGGLGDSGLRSSGPWDSVVEAVAWKIVDYKTGILGKVY